MKQRITNEQLKELTQEQQNKLRDWWQPKQGDFYIDYEWNMKHIVSSYHDDEMIVDMAEEINMKKDCLPELSIGQCIEFLCDSEFCFPSIGLTESSKRSELIVAGVTCLSGSKKYRGKTFEGNELIDALWEAVKESL